jgi:DNA mismatch endonuclease (patch repair protein)
MADVFSKRKRSEVMSRIRGRGNKDTELALARLLRANGIKGWRRQQLIRINVQHSTSNIERSTLSVGRWKFACVATVRPDFVFQKFRTAVFVDGCFWHGCPRHATWPAHRAAWWRRKIEGNKTRDRMVNRTLRRAGWQVLRIWECDLRNAGRILKRISKALNRVKLRHAAGR